MCHGGGLAANDDRRNAWATSSSEAFEPALYADCSPADVALAHLLLTPEPAAPSRTPIAISDAEDQELLDLADQNTIAMVAADRY